MRLRAGARRGRVAQAGLVVPVGIGATRLRRPQSFTRPATVIGLAPVPRPLPRRRSGLALEPPLSRQRSGLALGTTTFAPAPRSALGATTLAGARPPLWHRAPGSGRFSRYDAATHAALRATTLALALCPLLWGPRPPPWHRALLWRRTPALCPHWGPRPSPGHDPALASRPRFWAVFPPRCRDPRRLGDHHLCPGAALRRCAPLSGCAMRKTVAFGRWRSKQTVFRGIGSEKWTFLPVVRVWAFR